MPTQAERRAATRGHLIEVAARMFGRAGYEATATDRLLAEAGISKGAMYHHFSSKQALFEAVYERVSRGSIERALAGLPRALSAAESATERLVAGILGWLDEVRDPAVSRILLDDGPRVLGFARARALESETSLGLVVAGLERAVALDEMQLADVEYTARLLNAAIAEAALLELESHAPDHRERIESSLQRVIEGLGR